MHGLFKDTRRRRQSRCRKRFRNGQSAAVKRALTAAGLYLGRTAPTLTEAAASCGSNVGYVRAATILLKAENSVLADRVLRGATPLLAAAREAQHVAELVSAYRGASPADRAGFGKAIGAEVIFDHVVVPSA